MRLFRVVLLPLMVLSMLASPITPRPGQAYTPTNPLPFGLSRAAADYLHSRAPHGRPTTSAQAQATVANWTILIYMAADNDLESYALVDFNEMEYAGSSEGVNVVVQLDRAVDYDTADGDWTEPRRYFVTRDTNLSAFGSENVETLDESNTGDPATLVDFATWGIATYPAEHYALVIWDHGGAWLGVAADDSADLDDLTLPELDQALADIIAQSGIDQLDLIGFDACLMGAFEVYSTLAPYARYGVGSAELVPGEGWDYYGVIDALATDPMLSGDALGQAIVDTFITYYTEIDPSDQAVNLALVSLSDAAAVATAMDDIAAEVAEVETATLNAITDARAETPVYGAFSDPQYVDLWGAADLIQFMQLLSTTTTDENLQAIAAAGFEAGSTMMLYYRSSETTDPTSDSGMSVYYPRTASLFVENEDAQRYDDETSTDLDSWYQFLQTIYLAVQASADADALETTADDITISTDDASISHDYETDQTITATVAVTLSISADQDILIAYIPVPAPGQPIQWSGEIPYLTDGTSRTPVLVLPDQRDANLGVVDGTYYPQNGASVPAQLLFNLTTNKMVSIWGLRQTAHTTMPAQILPLPGDIFHPAWLIHNPDNSLTRVPAQIQFEFIGEPFRLEYDPAPVGEYAILTQIEDASGNIARRDELVAVLDHTDPLQNLQRIDPDAEDRDGDGIPNEEDNCPGIPNPHQLDDDGDGRGNACDYFDDLDSDHDGVPNDEDNCPGLPNPDQTRQPCAHLADRDQDGIPDNIDLCPDDRNPVPRDADFDGIGDDCDPEIQFNSKLPPPVNNATSQQPAQPVPTAPPPAPTTLPPTPPPPSNPTSGGDDQNPPPPPPGP